LSVLAIKVPQGWVIWYIINNIILVYADLILPLLFWISASATSEPTSVIP
jgi:hypothetical protein